MLHLKRGACTEVREMVSDLFNYRNHFQQGPLFSVPGSLTLFPLCGCVLRLLRFLLCVCVREGWQAVVILKESVSGQ